jgi:hypothetical protein
MIMTATRSKLGIRLRAMLVPLTLAIATVSGIVAGPASAAPAQTNTTVTSNVPITKSGTFASRGGVTAQDPVPAVFSCSYFSRVPFQSYAFTCTVQAGTPRIFLICSNGQRVNGPPMPAIHTYFPILSCPGTSTIASIMWEAL